MKCSVGNFRTQRPVCFTSPLTSADASQQHWPFSRNFTALLYEKAFHCYYLCKPTTLPKLRLKIIFFSTPLRKGQISTSTGPSKNTPFSSKMLQLKEKQDEDPRCCYSHSNVNTQHKSSRAAVLAADYLALLN